MEIARTVMASRVQCRLQFGRSHLFVNCFNNTKGLSGKRKAHWLHASGERHRHNRQHGFPQQIEFLQAPKNLF